MNDPTELQKESMRQVSEVMAEFTEVWKAVAGESPGLTHYHGRILGAGVFLGCVNAWIELLLKGLGPVASESREELLAHVIAAAQETQQALKGYGSFKVKLTERKETE